jgi:hypothetical protein
MEAVAVTDVKSRLLQSAGGSVAQSPREEHAVVEIREYALRNGIFDDVPGFLK